MCFQLKQPQYVTYTTHSIDIFDPAFALKAIDKNTTQDITDDSISNLPFSNSGSPYPSYLQIHMKEWGCPKTQGLNAQGQREVPDSPSDEAFQDHTKNEDI